MNQIEDNARSDLIIAMRQIDARNPDLSLEAKKLISRSLN